MVISFVLMRNNLLVADLSYVLWKPTDTFRFSQIICSQCLAGNTSPMGDNFTLNVSLKLMIKALLCVKKMCLSCFMLYLRRFQSMHYCVALIALNFHKFTSLQFLG